MGQLPADAPAQAAHSSRNRARRMKAARSEARRLVKEALIKRDYALEKLSQAEDALAKQARFHEAEHAGYAQKLEEISAQRDDAFKRLERLGASAADGSAPADRVPVPSDATVDLSQVRPGTFESLEAERKKSEELAGHIKALNEEIEAERAEKEEFRQEVLGLRAKLELSSGLSSEDVNGLVARAQDAEDRAASLAANISTLQSQAQEYERQLEEAKENYERLMRVSKDELQKRKSELNEIYDLHEAELETNGELRKDNANLADSIAKSSAELEAVTAERDELRRKLDDSSTRIDELETLLEDERKGSCQLRDSEQENTDRLNDLVQEKEALGRNLAQTQKARADAVAALSAAQEKNEMIEADLQAAREESYRQRHDLEQKIGELERGHARACEQARAAQGEYDKSVAEYESKIGELQRALESKQAELDRAASDSREDNLENLKKAVESERERADRAEGKARAAELLREDLETSKGKISALRRQLAVCSNLKDDLADAEAKLAAATATASDAENRARAAERDSGRLSRELERLNMKLAEESSRADGASAALQDADGVKSLALPHGLLPGEVTTVAFGSGFQKFLVKKLIYKSDGSIVAENEQGQSAPMGTWR